MAMDIGAVTPFPYALREREYINDLLEELCGGLVSRRNPAIAKNENGVCAGFVQHAGQVGPAGEIVSNRSKNQCGPGLYNDRFDGNHLRRRKTCSRLHVYGFVRRE